MLKYIKGLTTVGLFQVLGFGGESCVFSGVKDSDANGELCEICFPHFARLICAAEQYCDVKALLAELSSLREEATRIDEDTKQLQLSKEYLHQESEDMMAYGCEFTTNLDNFMQSIMRDADMLINCSFSHVSEQNTFVTFQIKDVHNCPAGIDGKVQTFLDHLKYFQQILEEICAKRREHYEKCTSFQDRLSDTLHSYHPPLPREHRCEYYEFRRNLEDIKHTLYDLSVQFFQ
ncbi:MAG: hypothetical protein LBJ89_00530 [Holosporales bacterium]|jgi:hypothetical protein|nr:hypothetical protein [Holosporales bacterium]